MGQTLLERAIGTTRRRLRRSVGRELNHLRLDAGLSLRETARAAGISAPHLLAVERGEADISMAALAAVSTVLGHDPSIRLFPSDGPRLRDHIQVRMLEAILVARHPRWAPQVEVAVREPARGVIDLTLHDPAARELVAAESHSLLHTVDAQVRRAREKADSLPSAAGWPWSEHPGDEPAVGRLLILRNADATRATVRATPGLFRAAYPAATRDAVESLTGTSRWPGSAIVWVDVRGAASRLMDGPPRGIAT